ncbi:hypothetical protein L7F22_004662 [Adiantum nelumboides]|nr:hypothetical protein [Adiantum nelumboides]
MAISWQTEATGSPSPILSEQVPLLVRHPLSSVSRTFANLVLAIIGSGVLGLPYTFRTVGWVMGILALVLSGAIVYHGQMLQVYSKHRLQLSRGTHLVIASFGDLMFHTFGPWARLAIDVMLTLSSFSGAISYIMFISQNVASVASGVESMHTLSSTVLPFARDTPLVYAIPSQASRISGDSFSHSLEQADRAQALYSFLQHPHESLPGSNANVQSLSSVAGRKGLMALISSSTNASCSAQFGGLNWSSSSTYAWLTFPLEVALAAIPSVTLLAPLSLLADALNLGALGTIMVSDVMKITKSFTYANMQAIKSMVAVPSAFGVGVYAFHSSAIIIPIEAAMKEPLKLGSVMEMAIVFSGVVYVVFAMLGYAAFGESTLQVITLNLQSGMEALLVKSAISIALFFAIPLVLNPAFELVERRFSQRRLSLALRTLLVFVVCLLATTVKQFTVFISLVGSSISCLVGFIIPAAVHIKVMREDDHNSTRSLIFFADILLISFGLAFGAFGTTISFIELF